MSGISTSSLLKHLQQAGQTHLLRYIDDLAESEARALVAQVSQLDFDLIKRAHESAIKPQGLQNVEPMPVIRDFKSKEAQWKLEGLAQIAAGRVGAIILAGGQGTRLGFEGLKGAYDAGFPSGKSIFQLQVERLVKVRAMANDACSTTAASLPLYVMTSSANDEETRTFFEKHSFFGMDPADVFLFEQGMIPAVTEAEGKVILETKSSVAMSPDGNGGLFAALDRSGAIADMERRGILYTHVFAVDNPLSCPGDPFFVGCCVSNNVEAGNLCVSKARWDERVGVAALRDGKFHVVEYSELTEEMAKKPSGSGLAFGAANICNHFFTTAFIRDKVIPGMKASHHAARKAIPCVDDPKPKTPNGIKLELFIFDAFPLASSYLAVEVDRESYFAPIKNASGGDSPATAKAMVTALHKKWLIDAGAELLGEGDCDISSLVSLRGEGLDKLVSGMKLNLPLCLDAELPVSLEKFGSSDFRVTVDCSKTTGVYHYRVVPKRPPPTNNNAAKQIFDKLASVDISKTTPIDAFFLLNELKELAANANL